MDEEGNIVILDGDGDPTGKSLKDFFEKDFKELKPKYYPGLPGGGGATGGKSSSGKDFLDLSPRERINRSRGV